MYREINCINKIYSLYIIKTTLSYITDKTLILLIPKYLYDFLFDNKNKKYIDFVGIADINSYKIGYYNKINDFVSFLYNSNELCFITGDLLYMSHYFYQKKQ